MVGNLSDFNAKVVAKSKEVLQNYTPEIEKALERARQVDKEIKKQKELEEVR